MEWVFQVLPARSYFGTTDWQRICADEEDSRRCEPIYGGLEDVDNTPLQHYFVRPLFVCLLICLSNNVCVVFLSK